MNQFLLIVKEVVEEILLILMTIIAGDLKKVLHIQNEIEEQNLKHDQEHGQNQDPDPDRRTRLGDESIDLQNNVNFSKKKKKATIESCSTYYFKSHF